MGKIIIMKHTIQWLNSEARAGNARAAQVLQIDSNTTNLEVKDNYIVLTDKPNP
jgi:hypothetical protein